MGHTEELPSPDVVTSPSFEPVADGQIDDTSIPSRAR
jgi:hypothetical protein